MTSQSTQPETLPTNFIDDPYYADCRQRDLNNEFMTDEQVDELLQSDDEDFDGFDE